MHYENPGFTAQDVFDDDEIQAMVPTKWMDILEGRAEAILPPRREALVAEFAGRSKRKGEEDSQNGGFCMMYSKQKFDNKGVSKDRKTVRNSFAIKHSYACQLRNIETGTQWLIIKTEEAPDSNDWQKRGDRWKNGRKTASRVKKYIAQTRNGLSSITS